MVSLSQSMRWSVFTAELVLQHAYSFDIDITIRDLDHPDSKPEENP